jgi:hypothetical protein
MNPGESLVRWIIFAVIVVAPFKFNTAFEIDSMFYIVAIEVIFVFMVAAIIFPPLEEENDE